MKSAPSRQEDARTATAKSTFSLEYAAANLVAVSDQREETGISNSLRDLRRDQSVDATLQNLLHALTLNLELRSRYRVFAFEASQDGYADAARLFANLRHVEGEQIGDLLAGLQAHLGRLLPQQPTEVAT